MSDNNIFAQVLDRVHAAGSALAASGDLPAGIDQSRVVVEPPRDPTHGDLATNAAMVLAKDAGKKPRDLAEAIAAKLRGEEIIEKVDVAGPGFINITLKPVAWSDALRTAIRLGSEYGRSAMGAGTKVNVEYVSANPTGPMHVGHGRGAVFGDALANLLNFTGHDVSREYYINDAGAQVDALARSAFLRYREALGDEIGAIPEGLYPGEYLKPVGAALAAEYGRLLLQKTDEEWLPLIRQVAVESMLVRIMKDLEALNVRFDVFFSEKSLTEKVLQFYPESGRPVFYCASESYDLIEGPAGGIRDFLGQSKPFQVISSRSIEGELGEPNYLQSTLQELGSKGLIYEGRIPPPKGAPVEDWEDREQTLFRATEFGDDVDRPLKKSDGSYTYFASDIAYHRSKFERGFTTMIDVWGADHGGYIKRMQAAVKAVTGGKADLDIKIVQLVRLTRGGEPVKMSKRSGEIIALRDVVDEVGRDAVRFMMLYRKNDAMLDFDLAKVIEQSRDNPVFYVQYGHARGESIFRNAREMFADLPQGLKARAQWLAQAELQRLEDSAELALMRKIALYPRLIAAAAAAHEPHRIAFYLYELASEFHAHWTRGKDAPHLRFIIQNDRELTLARLALVQGVVTVIASGLRLLGVEAPEEMR